MLIAGAVSIELEEILANFARDGFAYLGNVASPEATRAMGERVNEIMLGRVTYPGLFFQLDAETNRYDDLHFKRGYEGPSLEYRKIEKLEKDAIFRGWIENRLFERVARSIISGEIVIYRALIFAKGARGGSNLPWHQDGGKFWGLDRDPTLQVWTALDDAPEDGGCVEVIPGSHHAGLVTPLGGVIPKPFLDANEAESRAVKIPARAGDVYLIHNCLWHRSGVNRSGRPRRAFTVCYMSDQTKCTRKKKTPRIFEPVFRSETE